MALYGTPALSLLLATFASPAQQNAQPDQACFMAPTDRAWIEGVLPKWQYTAREKLKLPAKPLPTIVVFDARCTYQLPGGAPLNQWKAAPHNGQIVLPDGMTIPASVTSFARPDPSSRNAYFTMSLPSIWHSAGIKSGLGVEGLMDGVLMHEIMHTEQAYFANPRLDELTRRYSLPDDISDDSLQEAFENNPLYVAEFEAERDLLFAAAAAPDNVQAKRFAAEALRKMRARRAKWFVGDAEKWTPLEEVFLTMEGAGQWAAYAWYTDKNGGNLAPEVALREVRRNKRWWSQEQGLGLFLVVDRLVPNWQSHAFAPDPLTAEGLLEMAAH